jgi:hypothetical protein
MNIEVKIEAEWANYLSFRFNYLGTNYKVETRVNVAKKYINIHEFTGPRAVFLGDDAGYYLEKPIPVKWERNMFGFRKNLPLDIHSLFTIADKAVKAVVTSERKKATKETERAKLQEFLKAFETTITVEV